LNDGAKERSIQAEPSVALTSPSLVLFEHGGESYVCGGLFIFHQAQEKWKGMGKGNNIRGKNFEKFTARLQPLGVDDFDHYNRASFFFFIQDTPNTIGLLWTRHLTTFNQRRKDAHFNDRRDREPG